MLVPPRKACFSMSRTEAPARAAAIAAEEPAEPEPTTTTSTGSRRGARTVRASAWGTGVLRGLGRLLPRLWHGQGAVRIVGTPDASEVLVVDALQLLLADGATHEMRAGQHRGDDATLDEQLRRARLERIDDRDGTDGATGPTRKGTPAMSVAASPGGLQLSTVTSATSASLRPEGWREGVAWVCCSEVTATTGRPICLTSRAISMTTPLIPVELKMRKLSPGWS